MQTILVLGATGLIGTAVTRRLLAAGHAVVGLCRGLPPKALTQERLSWRVADIAALTTPDAWRLPLDGIDVIVNCAGALQSGPRDDVEAVHLVAMRALYAAAAEHGIARFVQISAPRVAPDATTAFSRTKALADQALAASGLASVILRPGLVLSPQAYGGSGLLRAVAALPWLQPSLTLTGRVQTVGVDDVAEAVLRAVDGRITTGSDFDLVEDDSHTFDDLVTDLRTWLGFAPARRLPVPAALVALLFRLGDGAVALGWRTPLCTTALREMQRGVRGDPGPWRAATGASLPSLRATLSRIPATIQERRYARLWPLKPAMIVGLAIFWLLSGAIGLASLDMAAGVLTSRGMPSGLAGGLVVAGSFVDLILGVAVLVRKTAAMALAGMLAVSLGYLVLGTMFAADLWRDPLGPYVKILPVMLSVLVAAVLLEER